MRAEGPRRREDVHREGSCPSNLRPVFACLVAVALMASLGTSKAVWPAHQRLGYYAATTSSGVTVTFRAVPGMAGENAVALDITDRRLGPATVGTRADGDRGRDARGASTRRQPITPAARSASRLRRSRPSQRREAMCPFTYNRPVISRRWRDRSISSCPRRPPARAGRGRAAGHGEGDEDMEADLWKTRSR